MSRRPLIIFFKQNGVMLNGVGPTNDGIGVVQVGQLQTVITTLLSVVTSSHTHARPETISPMTSTGLLPPRSPPNYSTSLDRVPSPCSRDILLPSVKLRIATVWYAAVFVGSEYTVFCLHVVSTSAIVVWCIRRVHLLLM